MYNIEQTQYPFQTGRFILNSDYRVIRYVDDMMKDIEMHSHDFFECIIFLSGDLSYKIGKQSFQLFLGDIIMLNIAEIHRPIMVSSNRPYDRISIAIDREYLRELSFDNTDLCALFDGPNHLSVLRPSIEEHNHIMSIIEQLSKLSKNKHLYGFKLLARAYIIEFLVCLGRINPTNINLMSAGKAPRIDKIKQYISNNLSSKMSLEQIAKEHYISKYHLAHDFKKNTSMTIHTYITKMRLTMANGLIRKGASVQTICSKCGFASASSYYRAYKKEFGITPLQYYESLNKTNTFQNSEY